MARVANYDADGNLVWSDDPTLDAEPTARITVRPQGNFDYSSAPLGPVVNSEWPTVKLPVEGYGYQSEQPQQELKDYVASLPVAMPQQLISPSTARQVAKAGANLFGSVGDQPRFQTFPEVIARSALTAPTDAAMGKFGITPEVPGQWSEMDQERFNQAQEDAVIRAQDTASLAGGATFGMVKPSPLTVAVAESSRVGAPISALERAPIFYSAVEHAVQNAKQNVATTDQWLGYLKNQPGVKQEELDWVLGGLPEGKITKKELEEHIAANKVELKEVNKGKYEPDKLDDKQYGKDLDRIAVRDFGRLYDHLLDSEQQSVRQSALEHQNQNPTKFSQWQLPGGEPNSYKEMLLSLPSKQVEMTEARAKEVFNNVYKGMYNHKSWEELTSLERKDWTKMMAGQEAAPQQFISSHWNEPNVLAHVRMNDRVIQDPQGNGGPLRSMHIEEIQSDWHQKGRKEGYKLSDAQLKEFNRIDKKIMDSKDEAILGNPEIKDALKLAVEKKIITQSEANAWLNSYKGVDNSSAVPDAPFKQSWPDLALKRIIRHAAENNYDAISFTPGEAQAARYDLSKHIESLKAYKRPSDGNYQISYIPKNQSSYVGMNEGRSVEPSKLADHVGKELADKIINSNKETNEYKGLDLKIGGEGMKAFYDKMLVDKANALAKKFGGKVEQSNLPFDAKKIKRDDIAPDEIAQAAHKEEWDKLVTEIRKKRENAADYDRKMSDKEWAQNNSDLIKLNRKLDALHEKGVDETIERMKQNMKGDSVHILKLPQSLKDAALHKGFPLFADSSKVGAGLSALERVQLNPLDHNPFTLETYHGAPSPFQGSEIKDNRGFFHTTDPSLAGGKAIPTEGGYARSGRPLSQATGNNVMPLKTDVKDYHTYDAKGKTWQEVNQFAINEANQLNKKGIIVKNVVDSIDQNKTPRDVVITLDPSTVRSKFAKFDPKDFGKSGLMLAGGLPIITNKNGDLLDHETLQPLKDHLANPTNESNQPLPTHKTEKPAVHLDKRALALALAKMASYGAWAARPALGPALWAADIAALGASGAASFKQRREGRPLANYKLVPVENPFK